MVTGSAQNRRGCRQHALRHLIVPGDADGDLAHDAHFLVNGYEHHRRIHDVVDLPGGGSNLRSTKAAQSIENEQHAPCAQ